MSYSGPIQKELWRSARVAVGIAHNPEAVNPELVWFRGLGVWVMGFVFRGLGVWRFRALGVRGLWGLV